jgi:hypothetical protein
VIVLDYKGSLGLQYNPNAVAQLALGYWDRMHKGEDRNAEFLTQAAYFLDHGRRVRDQVLLWEYEFPFQMRNFLSSPWRSALAQGQGISVCLRAFQACGDERYLTAAHDAFKAFRYLARDHEGGVLDDSEGRTWLEEYIVTPPNHVLNGFIWSLWGVRDYAVYFEDSEARSLWDACLETLTGNLNRYDLGFWTSYDLAEPGLPVMPASRYYQNLHIVQMRAMHALTGDDRYRDWADRWTAQLRNPLYKAASQAWKAWFKVWRF